MLESIPFVLGEFLQRSPGKNTKLRRCCEVLTLTGDYIRIGFNGQNSNVRCQRRTGSNAESSAAGSKSSDIIFRKQGTIHPLK